MADLSSLDMSGTDLEPIEEEPTTPATTTQLTSLITQADIKYSLKHYSEAAELYSEACQLQDELNGEMAPQNAKLFYQYGRALYQVAVAKSDVLGGQVAAEKKKTADQTKQKKAAKAESAQGRDEKAAAPARAGAPAANQPYFQISGVFEDSDEDEDDDDEEGEGAAEEEEDDFANAYEILDVSRILYERQVEALTQSDQDDQDNKGKGKSIASEMTPQERSTKESLAEVLDLQAEISLENERFSDAVPDFRAALALKQQLHQLSSSLIAEAHYKLSLALEFASVEKLRAAQAADGENAKVKKEDVDEEMRGEAARQMEFAIESCRSRLAEEEEKAGGLSGVEKSEQEKGITEVKEIIEDMEQRLRDLLAPAVLSTNGTGVQDAALAASNVLAEAFGGGLATEEQKAKIAEATKNANDLSGLVKRKKPKPKLAEAEPKTTDTAVNGKGKRKVDDEGDEREGKKLRMV